MVLYLVLLSTILAFSLGSTEQYVSSSGSNINSSLDSMRNASGHWITKVDTRGYTKKENPQPFSVNAHQEKSDETEQLARPSLHDTSMNGADQPTAASAYTTTTTTTTNITTPKSCPHSGYQLFAEFNCYKAFPDKSKTWSEAREQCMSDGGDLMVMETEQEREDVYIPLYNSVDWGFPFLWAGVYIPQGGDSWMSVKGGPALSTWWWPDYPVNDADRKCAIAEITGLLWNGNCAYTKPFICEISM